MGLIETRLLKLFRCVGLGVLASGENVPLSKERDKARLAENDDSGHWFGAEAIFGSLLDCAA